MNVLSRIVDVVCTINEAYWLYQIVEALYERRNSVFSRLRYRWVLKWWMIGCYVLIVVGLNSITLTSSYTIPIVCVQSILCIGLFWKCDMWNTIAVVSGYLLALYLVGGTEVALTGLIGGDRFIQITTAEQGGIRVLYLLVCGGIWYRVSKLFYTWITKRNISVSDIKYIAYVSIIGLMGCVFFSLQMLSGFNIVINAGWYVFLVIMFLVLFLSYYIVKYKQLQEWMRQIDAQNDVLERNYEQLSDFYKMNAKLYHDMKHHLDAMYYMLKTGGKDQVEQYIESIKEPIDSFAIQLRTGIDVVDVVLYEAEKKSQEKGIPLLIEAYAMPQNLAVEKKDLCALFSNLLDNALEAASKEIRVLVKMVHKQLLIQVQNDYVVEPIRKDGRFVTGKEDKHRHGYGIQNVEYVVNKYDGNINYDIIDKKFCVSIWING